MIIHIVRPGESLQNISKQYDVSLEHIIYTNEIHDPSLIIPGQSIVIPGTTKNHIVQPGQNIYLIAQQYGTTIAAITESNNLQNPAFIYPGQKLVIPVQSKSNNLNTIEVNAYIESRGRDYEVNIVKKVAPSLTYLSIFGYEINADGTLSMINDTQLIHTARQKKVAPLMVITNFSNGMFHPQLAHDILINDDIQNILINNIISILKNKQYYGVNVDFEKIFPEDSVLYHQFLKKFKARLNSNGFILSIALTPKHLTEMTNKRHITSDYPVHNSIADFSMLMNYIWGYAASPPMPVLPLHQLKNLLYYTLPMISVSKIMMGIALYGYDWTLPYIDGEQHADTISPNAAIELAQKYKTVIHYDNVSQAPYFNYLDEAGREHIVWFDDARSIKAKFELVKHLKLLGISYWILGRSFPQNWLILNDLFKIKKLE